MLLLVGGAYVKLSHDNLEFRYHIRYVLCVYTIKFLNNNAAAKIICFTPLRGGIIGAIFEAILISNLVGK